MYIRNAEYYLSGCSLFITNNKNRQICTVCRLWVGVYTPFSHRQTCSVTVMIIFIHWVWMEQYKRWFMKSSDARAHVGSDTLHLVLNPGISPLYKHCNYTLTAKALFQSNYPASVWKWGVSLKDDPHTACYFRQSVLPKRFRGPNKYFPKTVQWKLRIAHAVGTDYVQGFKAITYLLATPK